MEVMQKRRRGFRYRYKYIIKPKIEEIERIKHSLSGYKLYDIKIRFGGKTKYFNLNEEISFLSAFRHFKENIVCSARFIKDIGSFYTIREKYIDFDLIEESLEK